MQTFIEHAQETLNLLKTNKDEWEGRYVNYANAINNSKTKLAEKKTKFHKYGPLHVYLTLSEMKKTGKVNFSLRYLGQKVGKLAVDNAGKLTCCPALKNNENNFGLKQSNESYSWESDEAKELRKYFSNKKKPVARIDHSKKNNEHKYESMFLTYFEGPRKTIEEFKQIRPVNIIPGARFPMPTPLSASKKKVNYSNASGGNIDIFTRTGIGKSAHLNIMELKDENHRGEEPDVVLKQAIAYATFIVCLLRSESSEDWYELFGFPKTKSDPITVYATCLMPHGDYDDTSFANKKIYIDCENFEAFETPKSDATHGIIELHYMYFDEADNAVTNVETSLNK